MGIRSSKTIANPAGLQKRPRPVARDYVAELQHHAEKLMKHVEYKKETDNRDDNAKRQRQQVEQQMAQFRSEAVQARRLAEQIDHLSQDAAAAPKGNRAMTDFSIADKTKSPQRSRRAADTPSPGGNKFNFNPLHPSMELPPEQLIRLLGVESKKTRKHDKSRKRATKTAQKQISPKRESQPKPLAEQKPGPSVSENSRPRPQRRPETPPVFDGKSPKLVVPSLVVGVLVGAAVSAYLFWDQPSSTVQNTPAVASQPNKQQTQAQAIKRNTPASAKPASKAPAPATRAVPTPAISGPDAAKWQAAIDAERKRQRRTAEQRLVKQVIQMNAARELVAPPAAEGSDNEPVYVPETDLDTESVSEVPGTPASGYTEAAAALEETSIESELVDEPQPVSESGDSPQLDGAPMDSGDAVFDDGMIDEVELLEPEATPEVE